jgi:hypothetical protein
MNPIADDELILRHIPGGSLWQATGTRITSANFRLRHNRGETGVSVTRLAITSPDRLIELVGGNVGAGSRIAVASAGQIRALGLRVVPAPLDSDPGHAEIQSDTASLDEKDLQRRLANLFQFLEQTPPG